MHLLGLGPRVGFEEPHMLLKDYLPAARGSRGLRDSSPLPCVVPSWGEGCSSITYFLPSTVFLPPLDISHYILVAF